MRLYDSFEIVSYNQDKYVYIWKQLCYINNNLVKYLF